MGKISIFNYEIFYLDYLEGKLGEEDIRMLMEFLKVHPECELDDPDLPVLSVEDTVVFKGKSSLKQTDDNEAITLENVEHFMISDAEGIISEDKRIELNQVISQNPELQDERNRFGAVYFAPDMTNVYQDKGGLKRRKVIVLWPYISAVAAASVIAFVFLMNGKGSIVDPSTDLDVANGGKVVVPVKLTSDSIVENKGIVVEDSPVEVYKALLVKENEPGRIDPKEGDDNFTPLRVNNSRQIELATFDDVPVKPISGILTPTPMVFDNPTTTPKPATASVPKMNNPIQPITSFVSKKTNTPVEMGTRKKSEAKKGGFFFKVGKFEISKNKH